VTKAHPETAAAATGTPWRRYLMVGLPIVALAVAVIVIWWPRWQVKLAINGLNASAPHARAEHARDLRENADKDLVIEELLDAVADDSRTFAVRKICCDLLVDDFNRISRLNPLLKSGSLHTRGVILASLRIRDFFVKEYIEDPRYRVRETIVEWLRSEGDVTRMYAIQIAVKIKMKEVMPAIRPLLIRSGRAGVLASGERDLMIAAAGAVERFADCESVPVLMEIAEKDTDWLVRLRFMQILDRVAFRISPPAACPGGASVERMQGLVQKRLADADHRLRMGAMLILADHPAWTTAVAPTLQAILDGDAQPAERRQAFEALAALHEPVFVERMPRYFHDDAVEIRRTCARAVTGLPDLGLESAWVGLFADEQPMAGVPIDRDARFSLWKDVLKRLVRRGRGYKGFPMALSVKAAQSKVAFGRDLATLFTTGALVVTAQDGTFARLTRDGVSEAWFRWWCEDRGLDAAQAEKAVAAWQACRAARVRGDVAAAQAALDGAGLASIPQGLFLYERAWLTRHTP